MVYLVYMLVRLQLGLKQTPYVLVFQHSISLSTVKTVNDDQMTQSF